VWANGDVYTGEFENDEFHGHGSWSSASGEHYEGGACEYYSHPLLHAAPWRELTILHRVQSLYMVSGMAGVLSRAHPATDTKVRSWSAAGWALRAGSNCVLIYI
jgi:hypothetical protein